MKVKLGIADRLVMFGMLPPTGDIMELRMMRDLKKMIEITADEQERVGMVATENSYKWKPEESFETEYDFRDAEAGLIKNVLSNLNAKKQLTENHFSLWEKFMEVK